MPNGFRSIPMSPTERLDEVARLLALGFLRLRARRNAEKANELNYLSFKRKRGPAQTRRDQEQQQVWLLLRESDLAAPRPSALAAIDKSAHN